MILVFRRIRSGAIRCLGVLVALAALTAAGGSASAQQRPPAGRGERPCAGGALDPSCQQLGGAPLPLPDAPVVLDTAEHKKIRAGHGPLEPRGPVETGLGRCSSLTCCPKRGLSSPICDNPLFGSTPGFCFRIREGPSARGPPPDWKHCKFGPRLGRVPCHQTGSDPPATWCTVWNGSATDLPRPDRHLVNRPIRIIRIDQRLGLPFRNTAWRPEPLGSRRRKKAVTSLRSPEGRVVPPRRADSRAELTQGSGPDAGKEVSGDLFSAAWSTTMALLPRRWPRAVHTRDASGLSGI